MFPLTEDELVELEMAYEPYSTLTACLDMTVAPDGSLRECRRARNHGGHCASGFTSSGTFVRWSSVEHKEEL